MMNATSQHERESDWPHWHLANGVRAREGLLLEIVRVDAHGRERLVGLGGAINVELEVAGGRVDQLNAHDVGLG